jgi:pantoate kinase
MTAASAYAPGHITGLFQICDTPEDLLLKGARGSGVTINRGVHTKVKIESFERTSHQIFINSRQVEAPVTEKVLEKYYLLVDQPYYVKVEHFVEIPITAGFGSSGAGALSLSLALNEALGLNMTKIRAAQIAHIAEIECGTGLGSVTASLNGGFGVAIVPGGPGFNKAEVYEETEGLKTVYLNLGPISTKVALKNPFLRKRINEIGGVYVDKLEKFFSPQRFMEYSRKFAEHLNLITDRLRHILDNTDKAGYLCSMAMFGEVAFSVLEEDRVEGLQYVFEDSTSGQSITGAEIEKCGARLT